jgi:hypothetical protein
VRTRRYRFRENTRIYIVKVMKKVIAAIVAILPLLFIATSLSSSTHLDFRSLFEFIHKIDHQVPSPRFESPEKVTG